MKNGLKTSENLYPLASTIAYLLVLAGIIPTDYASEMSELIVQAIAGIVALGTIAMYMVSRTELKKKEIEVKKQEIVG
jgi:hypothetical protein